MSRFTYAGPFKNPASSYIVKGTDVYARHDRNSDGSCAPDTLIRTFSDEDDAHDFITSAYDFFEADYDQYFEENSGELYRMELREAFLNER